MEPRTIELQVRGMSCANCVRHVREALAAVPGVTAVDVDLASGRAVVAYAGTPPERSALLERLDEAGYDAA